MSTDLIPWFSLVTAALSAVAAIASVSIASGSRYTSAVMDSVKSLSSDEARADREVIADASASRRLSSRKRRRVTEAYSRQVKRLVQLDVVVAGIKGNGWVTAHARVLYLEVTQVVRELNDLRSRHGVRAPHADVRRANRVLRSLPPVKNSWNITKAKPPKGRVQE